jgi:hypothetical protein
MSFFLDIAQGNTGGFCWYDVSADPLAKLISPGLALGLTPGKRRAKYETASRERHHLPALQQNHHHRVNENERFASRIYHSPNSFPETSGSVTTEDVLNALEQYANPVLAML